MSPHLEEWTPSDRRRAMAWLTHLVTATGAIWGFMSVLAINERNWQLAFFWMALAVFVDAFDGLLARSVQVKRVLPEFDGALLDNIIDYVNYVFVPAYFVYQADLLPGETRVFVAWIILLTSAYQFCQSDAKTEDHYFKGFPSYWNIVVYYLVLLQLSPWINVTVLLFLGIMIFVPLKYVYPSRTSLLPRLTMGLGLIWAMVNLAILVQYPNHAPILVWLSLAYVAYYCALTVYAMLRD